MSSERVHLGQFVLDLGRYELTRAGKPVRVERIPMDLLILLVRESGRLVSREEIIERLWGKDVFFDTNKSINTAIRKIRRALGEDAEKPQYIETVLGKGYRFKGGTDAVTQMTSPQVEAERPRIMLAILPFENLSGPKAAVRNIRNRTRRSSKSLRRSYSISRERPIRMERVQYEKRPLRVMRTRATKQ